MLCAALGTFAQASVKMQLTTIMLFGAILLGTRAHPTSEPQTELLLNTTTGMMQGFINSTFPAVRTWLGLPYAEPPVGPLRWERAVPKSYEQSYNATYYRHNCMQSLYQGRSIYNDMYKYFLARNAGQSEDCLHLNIFAPVKANRTDLPVIVFIPGGGFVADGANVPFQEPYDWVQRSQSHIVVTVNYRLNIFGFPNSRKGTENLGLLDQRLAVEWVRDNIAAVGGSPERIFLWGQSAGGASVAYWPYAYPEDPIAIGLLSSSGVGHGIHSKDYEHSNFSFIADLVSCPHMEPEAEFECMKKVDAITLSQYQVAYPSIRFISFPDNRTVYLDMESRIAEGKVSRLPMLAGDNSDEGSAYMDGVPYDSISVLPEEWVQVGYDAINCPDSVEIQNRLKNNYTTYRYFYTGNFSNISPLPWVGAAHSADLPLVFGTHHLWNGSSTDFEWDVATSMQGLWLSFIEDPTRDPAYNGFTWPKYSENTDSMLVIAKDEKAIQLSSGNLVDRRCGEFL